MSKLVYLSTLSILILSGCASLPSTRIQLEKIYNVPDEEVVKSVEETITISDSERILPDDYYSSSIEIDDPVFQYGDSIKYRSNYKLFFFIGREQQKYKIIIKSHFRRWGSGFNKFVMIPMIYLLDGDGVIINNIPRRVEPVVPPIGPMYLHCEWEGSLLKTDKYYILVGADNRYSGNTAGGMTMVISDGPSSANQTSIPIDYNGYPCGGFSLLVSLK